MFFIAVNLNVCINILMYSIASLQQNISFVIRQLLKDGQDI